MTVNDFAKVLLGNNPNDRIHVLSAIDAFCKANGCDTTKEIEFEDRMRIGEAVEYLKRGYENLQYQLKCII